MLHVKIVLISICFLTLCACTKDDFINKQENDEMVFVQFDPYVEINQENPFEIDVTGDDETDLLFRVNQQESNAELSSKIYPLNESVLLSYGGFGSSFVYFVKAGDEIGKGTVMWEKYSEGMTLAGKRNNKKTGIWGLNNINEGYIALKIEKEEGARYGWMLLSATDSTITLKKYALVKIPEKSINAGEGI